MEGYGATLKAESTDDYQKNKTGFDSYCEIDLKISVKTAENGGIGIIVAENLVVLNQILR